MRFALLLALVATALSSAAAVSPASTRAAPGDLDSSFAGVGFRIDDLGQTPLGSAAGAEAATLEAGTELLAVGAGTAPGTVVVARYTENGSLDPSFGMGGVVMATIESPGEYRPEIVGMYVDELGRIVFAGDAGNAGSGFVARMSPDGETLDGSFGEGGVAHVPGDSVVEGLAEGLGGKPVVVGYSYPGDVAFVARLTAHGNPDPGFGSNGTTETEIVREGVNQGGFKSVVIDGEDTVAASGLTGMGSAYVARFRPEGTLDHSYGQSGIATLTLGEHGQNIRVNGLYIDPGDALLLVGTFAGKGFLARLTASGLLDQGFGTEGRTMMVFNPPGYKPGWETSEANAMAVESNGMIVVAGIAKGFGGGCFSPPPPNEPPCRPATTDRFALARYDAAGTLDPTFGSGGILRYIFDEETMQPVTAKVVAALIDSEGRLLISGGEANIQRPENGGYLTARFNLRSEVGSDSSGQGSTVTPPQSAVPAKCVVPQLKRDTVAQARRDLRRAGCRMGKVRHLRQVGRKRQKRLESHKKAGASVVVLSSRPRAGATFLTSARVVKLTVRREPSLDTRR